AVARAAHLYPGNPRRRPGRVLALPAAGAAGAPAAVWPRSEPGRQWLPLPEADAALRLINMLSQREEALRSGEQQLLQSIETRQSVMDPVAAPEAPGFPARPPLANQFFSRLGAASPPLRRWLWRCWCDLLAGRYQ